MSNYAEYNVSQMKSMSNKYAERVSHAANSSGNSIDLNSDHLILRLDKSILETMLSAQNCDGVLIVFGLDTSNTNPTQSVILVPCDKKDDAITFGGNSNIKGVEKINSKSINMKAVIYPNNGVEDIPTGITNAYNNLNII